MTIFGWILIGLIAGALAKAILPGRQGGGWFTTLALGIVGALLGGFIGNVVFDSGLQEFFSLQTWLLAIGGSVIVLFLWGMITGKRRA